MEWFFLILVAAILLLFLHSKLVGKIESDSKAEEPDPNFEEIFHYIDTSLKGYPDRFKFTDSYGIRTWTCHSRLFDFQVYLKKETLHYQFQIAFWVQLPFEFKIQRSFKRQDLKLAQSSGKDTRGLLEQKEIPALIQKLQFYDSLKISSGAVVGIKTFRKLEDLEEWPKTLGASITFLRFLLSYQDRKESSEKGPAVCPYCRNPVLEDEKAVSCRECRTIHHSECWNETDRCSVFGCGNKSEIEL
ncbi:hypothetical protein L0222_07010 [bacterium]|nr:hypothetical protein [bacterium]